MTHFVNRNIEQMFYLIFGKIYIQDKSNTSNTCRLRAFDIRRIWDWVGSISQFSIRLMVDFGIPEYRDNCPRVYPFILRNSLTLLNLSTTHHLMRSVCTIDRIYIYIFYHIIRWICPRLPKKCVRSGTLYEDIICEFKDIYTHPKYQTPIRG